MKQIVLRVALVKMARWTGASRVTGVTKEEEEKSYYSNNSDKSKKYDTRKIEAKGFCALVFSLFKCKT